MNILKSKWTFWNQSEHFEIKVEILSKTYWKIRLKIGLLRSVYYTFAYYNVLKLLLFVQYVGLKRSTIFAAVNQSEHFETKVNILKSKWTFWNQSEHFEIKVNILKSKWTFWKQSEHFETKVNILKAKWTLRDSLSREVN